MKYRIELTEEQMRVLEKCCDRYMRYMMGQTRDIADDLAFYDIDKYNHEDKNWKVNFERMITKRDAIEEILKKPKYIYMYVTKDEYELPIAVADYPSEIARIAGTTSREVMTIAKRAETGRYKNPSYRRVLRDE